MATIDDDLSQLERDTRTLKIEYEQYFGGGRSRPPADTQWRVESLIRRYNERMAELSTGQRFRFNNITQTYAKYQEMWSKKTAQKEGATQAHHFGAAAKAVEAERAARAAMAAQKAAEAAAKVTEPPAIDFRAAEAAARIEDVKQTAQAFAMSFSNPEHEREKVYTLYEKLIEARTETGERSTTPSLQDFEKFVQHKTKELKDKGGREIEYTVSVEGGRVKLKARVSS